MVYKNTVGSDGNIRSRRVISNLSSFGKEGLNMKEVRKFWCAEHNSTHFSEQLGDVELAEADIVYWHECPTEAPDGYEWRKLTDKQRMQLCRQQLEDVLLALADMAADIRLVDAQALEHVLAVCAGAAKLVR